MTEVLPLPTAATTGLRRSSTTTALRCSSVKGRASILSKNPRERFSWFSTKVSFALAPTSSGASGNANTSRSSRNSGASESAAGQFIDKPATAVRATAGSLRSSSAARCFGRPASPEMRRRTARRAPVRSARARRHQPRRAVSSASARPRAAALDSPETCSSPPAWRIRRPRTAAGFQDRPLRRRPGGLRQAAAQTSAGRLRGHRHRVGTARMQRRKQERDPAGPPCLEDDARRRAGSGLPAGRRRPCRSAHRPPLLIAAAGRPFGRKLITQPGKCPTARFDGFAMDILNPPESLANLGSMPGRLPQSMKDKPGSRQQERHGQQHSHGDSAAADRKQKP